jgi:uncharacterized protein (TIGR00297 family)
LPLAATISAAVAGLAWRAGTLTRSGALGAWVIGTLVLHGTGWSGGAVLAAFFISSNLVSRIGPRRQVVELDPKGDRRDIWQVFANGSIAAAAALVGRAEPELGLWLVTASLAAAAADTWATSLGTRSTVAPRLLGFGRSVPPGTNGGMTPLGSVAALAGALMVAATGAAVAARPRLLPLGILIGFIGMVVDSLLGATAQGRFRCPACQQSSERRVHRCGTATIAAGGLRWLGNDLVNFLATAVAAGAALAAWCWLD